MIALLAIPLTACILLAVFVVTAFFVIRDWIGK